MDLSKDTHANFDSEESDLFLQTRWSLVQGAGSADETLRTKSVGKLFQIYRRPLEMWIRQILPVNLDVEDVLQETFRKLIDRNGLEGLSPADGRFRNFLKACMKNVMLSTLRKEASLKRSTPFSNQSYWDDRRQVDLDDTRFDAEWAVVTVSTVIAELRADYQRRNLGDTFDQLVPHLLEDGFSPNASANSASADLPLAEGSDSFRQAIHRLRERFKQALHRHVAATVADDEVEAELLHLKRAFAVARNL